MKILSHFPPLLFDNDWKATHYIAIIPKYSSQEDRVRRKSDFVTFLSPVFIATCVRKIFNERFRSRDMAPLLVPKQGSPLFWTGVVGTYVRHECLPFAISGKIRKAKLTQGFPFGIANLCLTWGSLSKADDDDREEQARGLVHIPYA